MIELLLRPKAFGDEVSCTGAQLARVIGEVGKLHELRWYEADVEAPGAGGQRSTTPVLVGDTAAMVRTCGRVNQFLAGVFIGVPEGAVVAGERFADRDDGDTLAPAIVEVRARDATFVEIVTADERIERHFVDAYGVKPRRF